MLFWFLLVSLPPNLNIHVTSAFHSAPGDYVSDTPPELDADRGCTAGRDSCNDGEIDDVSNHMSYNDDSCRDHFTVGVSSKRLYDFEKGLFFLPANAVITFRNKANGKDACPAFCLSFCYGSW